MRALARIIVVIVGYCNPDDLVGCLAALARLDARSRFEVVIAENGGSEAVAAAKVKLQSLEFLEVVADACAEEPRFGEQGCRFRLARSGASAATVHLAGMSSNLGYAGAINACLKQIDEWPGWEAVWILNPDTKPMAGALWELTCHAAQNGREMVGSRLCTEDRLDRLRSCGLKWSKIRGQTGCVGLALPVQDGEDSVAIERQLDAPSGASVYVTRSLLRRLGMMDESYFLYFEDLDWGLRAKSYGSIGYAHGSIVCHQGGTTIGSARSPAKASYLATYLEFRNRILFVRKFYPAWLGWTVAVQIGHAFMLVRSGGIRNLPAACNGLTAGLKGETGRPDRILARHKRPLEHVLG